MWGCSLRHVGLRPLYHKGWRRQVLQEGGVHAHTHITYCMYIYLCVCLQREVLQEGGVVRAEDATLVEFSLHGGVCQLVAQLDDADGLTHRVGDGHREHTACQAGCVRVRLHSNKLLVVIICLSNISHISK